MDHVKDTNKALLFRLNTVVPLPEFVKEAGETTEEDIKELPSRVFADPNRRMFPMHTAHDTWLSREYFNKFARDEYAPDVAELVAHNLETAAELWNLPESPALEKVAAEEGTLIEYNLNGENMASVRVHGPMDLTKLAHDLVDNRHKYPWEMRRDVARQLLAIEKIGEYTGHHFIGDMLSTLQKTAGYATGGLHDALGAVQKRIGACKGRHNQMIPPMEELTETLQKSAKNGLVSPDMLDKTAGLLDAVDRFSDLHKHYPAPEREIFTITVSDMDNFEKKAVKLPSGQLVSKTALEDFNTRRYLRDDLGVECSPEDVVEKVAVLSPHKSQMVYEFLSA